MNDEEDGVEFESCSKRETLEAVKMIGPIFPLTTTMTFYSLIQSFSFDTPGLCFMVVVEEFDQWENFPDQVLNGQWSFILMSFFAIAFQISNFSFV